MAFERNGFTVRVRDRVGVNVKQAIVYRLGRRAEKDRGMGKIKFGGELSARAVGVEVENVCPGVLHRHHPG